ncbi:MAG: tetratricopeptide repeat protein [Phycisphaeraceae bacterium]|nr:tetratricopeptide repeat protein [Phycisphaeraceae bacterium]
MRPTVALLLVTLIAGSSFAVTDQGAAVESAISQIRAGKPLAPADLSVLQAGVDEALASSPGNERALYAKALLDRAKGDRRQAKAVMEGLVKSSPAVAEYHATYGTLCFEVINTAGTFEQMSLASTGRAEYEKAIQLDSSLIEPRVGLGRFFLMAPGYAGGSYRKAEEQANALIALPDGKGEVFGRSLLGDIYADKGDWAKMEEQYNLAESAKGPNASPSIAMRGYAQALLTKKKDPAAALVVLERYRAVASADDAGPWYLTGEAKKALGDDEGAIAAYLKAVEIAPSAANSRYAIAQLLEKKRRFAEAAAQYREFASRFPADSRAAKAAEAAGRCEAMGK